MRLLCIGDNVADCYLYQRKFYPGGNAVNVAVNCRRNGIGQVAYLGIFGDDDKAAHIRRVLRKENVDISRCRRFYGVSGQPIITLSPEGDRLFSKKFFYTCQNVVSLKFIQPDWDYMAGFDLCHTSCYSFLETELPRIREQCDISFDFSDIHTPQYMEQVCPYIRYAFFSGSHMEEAEIHDLIRRAHALGCEIVGVTRGGQPAIFSRNGQIFEQPGRKVQVVDTMGAGDSFIAGFLTEYSRSGSMEQALSFAADRAAETCTHYGGIGYPAPLKGYLE